MNEQVIALTLPYPPSVNTYWRRVGNRTLMSAEGRRYKLRVQSIVSMERAPSIPDGDVSVEIVLFPPDRRRRDIDNCAKAILDSLEAAGVFTDDAQVARLVLVRGAPDSCGLGSAYVTVSTSWDD